MLTIINQAHPQEQQPMDQAPQSLEDLLLRSAQSLNLNLSNHSIESTGSIDYLSHLSSLPLPDLINEPNRLSSISTSLESDLSVVCFREFKSFLISHQASLSIKKSLESFDSSIDRFIIDTDSLRSKVINFNSTVQPILDDRNQIELVLDHLTDFENLLELPQLISTCINHRLSNQAIDLALKLRKLDSNLSSDHHYQHPISTTTTTTKDNNNTTTSTHHSIGIVHRIRNQVDRTLQSLRDQLLNRLADHNLRLPSAIRTIITLRRLSTIFSESNHHVDLIQPISESELRVAFLTSRWQSLSETLRQLELSSSIPNSPPPLFDPQAPHQDLLHQSSLTQPDEDRLKFLRRWLEIWREIVGDTLSIYLDIFLNPTSTTSFLLPPNDRPSQQPSLPQFLDDPQTPLNLFLTQAIHRSSLILKHHLNFLVSVSSLASLLTQLAYCGGAFGKWGLDFTRTVCPSIVNQLERLINSRMQVGLGQFHHDLKAIITPSPSTKTNFQNRRRSVNPFLSMNHSSTFIRLENCLISPDSLKQALNLEPEELNPGSSSEKLLTSWLCLFPPLARFVNSQLSALNELRLLPAAGSYKNISDGQFECLKSATEELRKIILILPESRLDGGNFLQAGHENETLLAEDPEKKSEYQFRLILYRFILLWSRNILPFLERALRIGIYEELGIQSVDQRFIDLFNEAESLLSMIIPQTSSVGESQPSTSPAVLEKEENLVPGLENDDKPNRDEKADNEHLGTDLQVDDVKLETDRLVDDEKLETDRLVDDEKLETDRLVDDEKLETDRQVDGEELAIKQKTDNGKGHVGQNQSVQGET